MTSPEPRRWPAVRSVADAIRQGSATPWGRSNAEHFGRSVEQMERGRGVAMLGTLHGDIIRADGSREALGLMSCRVITTAGVNFLVDCLQGLTEPELLRFHGVGTGTTAEAATQTALVTELTTQYATANTRPTGTLAEQAGNANVFETVASVTVSAAAALTEHGIFTQAAAPGGVMLDRSVFAVVNLAVAEALQVTYRLTLPSGG